MINDFLEKINRAISEEEAVELIKALVKIPSHPPSLGQEKDVAEYIHKVFQSEGIESELQLVEDERYNVIARLPGKGNGKKLLLTGHMDTVPVYDMEDPYDAKVEGDKLIGRGTVDMKGPLACMMLSMIAIKRSGIQLDGDLCFAGVIDEEEKSLGTIDLIEKGMVFDGAIVGEPTNLDICVAHRGLEWLEFEITGKTVHGGKQSEGINAILKATDFINLMEERIAKELVKRVHPITGTSTMNYGTINGGTQPSTVAGSCNIKIDRRWIPGEKYNDVLNEYSQVIEELNKKDPDFICNMKVLESSVMKKGYTHEAMEIDVDCDLVNIIRKATIEITEKVPEKTYFPAWSDGGLLDTYAKIPTLVFAPGDLETAHSKDEFISIKQLTPAIKIYALTAYYFCK